MKANKIMITQAELKELLTYNPETGIFNWLVKPSNRVNISDAVGSITDEGYIRISIKSKRYRAHRLAWLYIYAEHPKNVIDHINHICDDNRIVNLREASRSQNGCNQGVNIANTSGLKGVYWNKSANKWHAQIRMSGKKKYLGYFTDKNEAYQAYCKAADEYHKEFANHG
tara:strand:- start:145 stop:654 length:510 start_codon:yes stop_codon:yes gene_type:complete